MATTIETKFEIGQVVWFANCTTERRQHPCPDCKGEKKWKATAPSGREYTFSCPRCSGSFRSNSSLSIDYTAFTPVVDRRTIGQIRTVTPRSDGDKTQYMCVETGVGSGQLYDEDALFLTEEEAAVAAKAIADERNRTVDWAVKQFDQSLEISDYQLDDAREHAEKKELSSFQWKVRDFVEDIRNCETMTEVVERIDEWER